jgi:hypothetical protein
MFQHYVKFNEPNTKVAVAAQFGVAVWHTQSATVPLFMRSIFTVARIVTIS